MSGGRPLGSLHVSSVELSILYQLPIDAFILDIFVDRGKSSPQTEFSLL
jgi:hypothetical protein